jgi:hypothetical protein
MHPIEDKIEDAYVEAMDIVYRAIGREVSVWYSEVYRGDARHRHVAA